MWRFRPRLSIRLCLLVVALVGVNLATFAVAWRATPRITMGIGMAGASFDFYSDGSIIVRDLPPPGRSASFRPYMQRPPSVSSQVRRWAPPMVVSVLTVLLVIIAVGRNWRKARRRSSKAPDR
jgi:hypothetical protein